MKRGRLSIVIDEHGRQSVVFQSYNQTIWMNKNELCELFGIYLPEVEKCINSIFSRNLYYYQTVSKYHSYVKDNHIHYDITDVCLEVIIAMSFNIDSINARVLREWFISYISKPKGIDFPLADINQYFNLN